MILALFGAFFIVKSVFAETIFFDDFENYQLGNLNGQGNWKILGNSSDVSTGDSYSGLKSIVIEKFEIAEKTGNSLATGTLSFWFKLKDTFFDDSTPTYVDFYIKDGGITEGYVRIICYEPITNIICETDGLTIEYNRPAGGLNTYWATSTPYIWNNIKIEWDNSKGIRYTLNNGIPTTWIIYFGLFNTIDTLVIDAIDPVPVPLNNLELYIDFIAETATSTGYIIPELGLPELPVLENCSILGITDRLLCELKNFFSRLFVPSPDKITELKDTLDTIKTKFPYNYIKETQNFFTDIKNGINENSTTTFMILGQEGSIDFAFWNATTTLAGYTQSLLDIFRKITTFVIVLIFGFWLLSFLKRIF